MDRSAYFSQHPERLYLNVPFAEKEAARELGGRWDPAAPREGGGRGLWWLLWPAVDAALEQVARWLPNDFPKGQDCEVEGFEDPHTRLALEHPERAYLAVPLAEKDECKQQYAGRWDPQAGLWYITAAYAATARGEEAVQRWPMPDRAATQERLEELRDGDVDAMDNEMGGLLDDVDGLDEPDDGPYENEWGYEPFDAWVERNYGAARIERERRRGMLGRCWAEAYEGGCVDPACRYKHRGQ